MIDILKTKYSQPEIDNKRREISKLLISQSPNIKSGDVRAISPADLELLFQLYDRIFLQNWFKESFKGKMKFSLSKRMTKSAGMTLYPRNIRKINPEEQAFDIRIGVDFFLQYGQIEGSRTVCGLETGNSLEALQIVFEHELCHVMEFILFKESSCNRERFKTIAGNLFGHTESHHRLPTNRQIAKQKLGLEIGDTVSFTFQGKRFTGILYNINKRATILVRDAKGLFIDPKGRRYSKYYVPLKDLECKK